MADDTSISQGEAKSGDVAGGGVASRLWGLTEGYRRYMAAVGFLSTLSAALETAAAALVALIVGELIAGDRDRATLWSGALFGALILSCLLQMAGNLLAHRVAIEVHAETRLRIGRKLWAAPLGAIQRFDAARIRRTLMEDIERIEDGIAHLIPDLVAISVAPVFLVALMFAVDWRMAVAVLAPIVTGIVAFSMIMRRDGGLSSRFVEAQAAVDTALQEAVTMVPVIKAFGIEPQDLTRAEAAFRGVDEIVGRWLDFSASGTNWFALALTSTFVIAAPLGLWLYPLPQGISVLVFFLLSAFILSSIGTRLFGAMGRLRIQEASLARVDALIGLPDLLEVTANPEVESGLRFENVSFAYSGTSSGPISLSNIDLEIRSGEKVALVGPSGSGKSTLARLLLRSFDPQAGRITLGGRDIRSFSQRELAGQFTAVFQDTFLFSKSVGANIALGRPDATGQDIVKAARLAQADGFIRALPQGYETVLHRGEGLSGGQKQRIAIARAILKDAPIVVLDEATAYLDPDSQHEVQQALDELAKGRTLIAIAHRLSSVRHFDRIVYLLDGRIVESGNHDDLIALDGAYARQWRSHLAARSFTLDNEVRNDA